MATQDDYKLKEYKTVGEQNYECRCYYRKGVGFIAVVSPGEDSGMGTFIKPLLQSEEKNVLPCDRWTVKRAQEAQKLAPAAFAELIRIHQAKKATKATKAANK